MKEPSDFCQIVHNVLSENVICVVGGGFVTKGYNGHDMFKRMRLESSDSWKPP
jgi:hypothetical protein